MSGSQKMTREQKFKRANSLLRRLIEFEEEELPKFSEILEDRLENMNLMEEDKVDLKTIVRKLEEKNMILSSKVGDMKLLIEEMMSQFRELVSKDYIELQKIRKEMMLKNLYSTETFKSKK